MHLLAVIAVAALCAHADHQPGAGGGKQPPEPKTTAIHPHMPFDDCREAMLTGPMAERLTVTVRSKGQSAASANILLRTAPGKERNQLDAKVSIEAGDLRVYAEGGTLTAVAASNPTAYYSVDLEGPATPDVLAKALHPLPLPELAVFFSPEGSVVTQVTPVTRPVTWAPTTVPLDPPLSSITLSGDAQGKSRASITFEYQTEVQGRPVAPRLRIRSFACPLPSSANDERTISITSAWTDPGDPVSWKITTDKRTRVDSLAALGIKVEPPPPPAPEKKAEPEKKTEPEKQPGTSPGPKPGDK